MNESTTSCPYCNAQLTTATLSARGKSCPRCGELLPAALQSLPVLGETPAAKPPERLSNRAVGLSIFAGMIVVGLIGLAYALWTQDFRRKNDYKVAPVHPEPLQAPGEWAALGYLPTNCKVVVGIQLAELQKDPHLGKLLKTPRPANLDFALGLLETWSGLRCEDLDHAVAGVSFDGLQATLVLITTKPYEPASLAKALKAEKAADLHGKPVHAFRLEPYAEGRLWSPDRRTLVIVLRPGLQHKDLAQLPFPPRAGSQGLAQPIRDVLSQRLGPNNALWIAGHGDWEEPWKLLRDKLPLGKAKDAETLVKVKTFGLGVKLEETPVILGSLQAADDPHRQALANYLDGLQIPSLRVVVPTAGAKGPDSHWISLQRRLTIEELTTLLGGAGKK